MAFSINLIIFNFMKGNAISTPEAVGTILPGITRKSIIDIAVALGYQVTYFPSTNVDNFIFFPLVKFPS